MAPASLSGVGDTRAGGGFVVAVASVVDASAAGVVVVDVGVVALAGAALIVVVVFFFAAVPAPVKSIGFPSLSVMTSARLGFGGGTTTGGCC